jgi:hypothetical protein
MESILHGRGLQKNEKYSPFKAFEFGKRRSVAASGRIGGESEQPDGSRRSVFQIERLAHATAALAKVDFCVSVGKVHAIMGTTCPAAVKPAAYSAGVSRRMTQCKALAVLTTVVIGLVSLGGTIELAWAEGAAAGNATQQPKLAEIVKEIVPSPSAKKVGENDLQAYLLVYFKDETHSIYFAVSKDGYAFTDVNDGQPVLLGKDLAEQKGVRDAHIMRGPDGGFYLSMTDLHIFAKREGLRDTQWERPQEAYDWGNNRALIFMKSYDLIHWTHSLVHVGQEFPEFGDIGCVWAPETIFDPDKKKLMVYFTTRIKTGNNFIVYSYADDAFTKLETIPKPLFTYPKEKVNTIDGDITKVGERYHLFYVAHDRPGGLRHAASDKINEGYVYEPQKVDPERVACEAPNLWRRNGTDAYVLMYDVFGVKPNNMGFSETTDFVNYKNLGRFNDKDSVMKATNFSGPKHGAVMSITMEELDRLEAYFAAKKQ